ncbi:YqgE/AlgH family protein [Ferrimonas balearica]|uniref:YqgE/AlgH family protein n=1 Tax=Ferrimonas balearica TaxID=44012 RepID=UPI001C996090|nr:YqgE/AlgH family protein [Ferrimonas balearica]MBY5992638.1 YqgE/AlgH family protein [Ferrimonas balearica]
MNSLHNHLLIAMPSLQDPFFKRSVTYLCEHNDEGAMGLVINQPIDMDLDDLLRQMKIKQDDFVLPAGLRNRVVVGGPVTPERGFVLHSPVRGLASSQSLTTDLMITTSKDVLATIGSQQAPSRYLVALGYAGWSAGQLEEELASNSWLTIPADLDLLFDVPLEERWSEATRRLGIDVWQLSSDVGHS